jgi:hypothetical protein
MHSHQRPKPWIKCISRAKGWRREYVAINEGIQQFREAHGAEVREQIQKEDKAKPARFEAMLEESKKKIIGDKGR